MTALFLGREEQGTHFLQTGGVVHFYALEQKRFLLGLLFGALLD